MYLCPVSPKPKEKGSDILITDLLEKNEECDIDEELEELQMEMPEFAVRSRVGKALYPR
jgi:uncharacterized ferredoxin-like protein